MTVQSEFTNEDWSAYVQFIRRRITQDGRGKSKRFLMAIGLGVVIGLIVAIGKFSIDPLSILLGSLGMFLWIVMLTRAQAQAAKPSPNGVVLGPYSISIGDDGIRTIVPGCETLYRWKTVRGTEVAEKHVFVIVDTIAAITIPRRAFNAADDQADFLNEIQKAH